MSFACMSGFGLLSYHGRVSHTVAMLEDQGTIVVGRTGEGRKECERSGLRCGTGMWSSVLLILVVLVAAGFLGSEARLPDGLATILAWISWVASETRGLRGRCMNRGVLETRCRPNTVQPVFGLQASVEMVAPVAILSIEDTLLIIEVLALRV